MVNGISFGLPEAPVFTEIPLDQTVTEGDSVTFTAQATGFPVPTIAWHFIDGSSVDHLLSTVGNTLTFSSQFGDAGQYYAVASNEAGTVNSTPAAVLTVNPDIVVNGNFAANAAGFTEGNSYFAAQSPGNPESATGWTGGSGIDGTLGSAPDYFGPINRAIPSYLFMQGTQTVTQTITTTPGQSYRFSFKAACRQGNTVGLTVWADNTQAPNLIIPDGGLSGTSFQDYSFIFTGTGTGTQTIQFVNSGTGDFTANVTNVSVTEYVGPPEAPVFTEIPLDQTVIEGDSVTFTAQATGSPTPLITWHFIDSGSVDHTLSTVGNTLTFTTSVGDVGQYYAVASNSVATVSSTPTAVLTLIPNIVTNGNFAANAADFTQGNSYFASQSPGNPESAPGWTGGSGIGGTLGSAPDYFGPVNGSIPSYLFMQGTQTVTQTITTTPGQSYRFSFKAACRQNNTVGLTVWADNTQAPNLIIPDGGLSGTSFQDYSFVFTGTGTGTQTIQFVNSGTGDFTANVTNVSVTEYVGPPEAPVFTEIPQSQTVTSGDSVTFTAQATGYPTPLISWHFIDSGSVDHLLSTTGNTLTFSSRASDAGQYYAVASNSVATVNSIPPAVLTVNPGLVDETDLSLSGGSFAPLAGNNLILGNAGSSALSITSDGDGVGSPSLLTDGDLRAPQTGGPLGITGGSITYDLGSGANGVGYDITGIRSLSAWADGGRFKPKYAVSYSADGSNFTPLWTVNYSTATGNGADVSLAINSLHNVRYVKFDFSGGQQNGWVSYTELAVFGTSTAAADPFAGWINGLDWTGFTSPDLTPTGDPDGDSMSNQQEFAFGLDPRFGTSINPIRQQLDKASGTFKYTRTKSSGLSYVYQYSTTLSEPWDAFVSETPLPDAVSISDTVEEVTVTVPAALLNANSKLFVRVKAQ